MRILIGFDPRRASSPTAQWAAVEGACLLGYERTSDVLTSQVTSRLRSFDRCWLSLYRVYGRRPELNAVADREASLSPNEAKGRPLFPHGRRRGALAAIRAWVYQVHITTLLRTPDTSIWVYLKILLFGLRMAATLGALITDSCKILRRASLRLTASSSSDVA